MKTNRRGFFEALGLAPAAAVLAKYAPEEVKKDDEHGFVMTPRYVTTCTVCEGMTLTAVDSVDLANWKK